MENRTNNYTPMNEVDEIRQQIAIFKQRLEQQEIISDRLLRRSMKARLDFFAKGSVIADIIALFLMPVMFWGFGRIGLPWYFCGFILLMLMIEAAYSIFVHSQLQRLFTNGNDLLTVRRGLLKLKRNERLQILIEVPVLTFWMLAICWQLGLFGNKLTGVNAVNLVTLGISFFIGLAISLAIYVWGIRRINKSIMEIDELEQI